MSNPWASTYDELRAPYLQEKKAKKDYDGDGKVETGSKEHAGVVHNAIQRAKGGKPDGKDTRKEENIIEKKKGLWDNIHAKRKRGERPAKPGEKDYPKTLNVEAKAKYDNTKSPDHEKKKAALAKKHGGYDKIKGHPQYEHHGIDIEHMDGRVTEITDVVKAPKIISAPRYSEWRDDFVWNEPMEEALKNPKLDIQEKGVKNKVEVNPTVATESMKQARKNVGASTCWDGYKAKGTKMKNGRKVPNCVKEDEQIDEKMGLYANIHAKRKRGGKMRKKGAEGAPTDQDFKDAAKTAKEEYVSEREGYMAKDKEGHTTGGFRISNLEAKKARERLKKKMEKRKEGMKKEEVDQVDEGSLKQARKNVGASTCWDGYKAKGTKMKNGRAVPNCVKEEEKKKLNELDNMGSKAGIGLATTVVGGGLELMRRAKKAAERIRQKKQDSMNQLNMGEGVIPKVKPIKKDPKDMSKPLGTVKTGVDYRTMAQSYEPEGDMIEGNMSGQESQLRAKQNREKTVKTQILNKKLQLVRKGQGQSVQASYEPDMPVLEATRQKKEMGYDKGGTRKPTAPKQKDTALDIVKRGIIAKHGKGAIMRSGSNQQKKVRGEKSTAGTGKYKKMADGKRQLKKDAKEMGYGSNTKGYIETKARYGSKSNMKSGKGLGT